MQDDFVGEPTKKSRKVAILAFIGVAIVILFIGYITVRGRQAEAQFRLGAGQHQRAAGVLVKMGKLLEKTRMASESTSKLRRELRALRVEVSRGQEAALLAAKRFGTLEKTAPGSDRRAGATEARQASEQAYSALKTARQLAIQLDILLVDAAGTRAAAAEFDSAFEKADAGILLANQNKFGEAKDAGKLAVSLFERAIARLDQLRSRRIKADLGGFRGSAGKGKDWADGVIRQAEAGGANNVPEYNKLVEQTNSLSKQVAAGSGGMQRQQNRVWVEHYESFLIRSLTKYTKMADKHWQKAIDLWSGKS